MPGGTEVLPVLAAALVAALGDHQATGSNEWSDFLTRFFIIVIGCLPLMAAHIAANRLSGISGTAAWLAGFVVLPLSLAWTQVSGHPFATWHWLMAAGFSLASLLAGNGRSGRMLIATSRLPVTLDGAMTVFVAVFVLTATSMFASVDDPVNNQPFRDWFDAGHIAASPLTSLRYLAQFAVVGAMILGFYWCCRIVLVRRILRDNGWVAFLLASLVTWLLYSPFAASLVLLLPLNADHWTLLPSENHNPFDPLNYFVSAASWAVFIPLILISDRLQAESRAASERHEQARAELHRLHQQINPHFLFNSLNTLYALCLHDRAASAEAIIKLSDLLRYVVYQGGRDHVGLDEEIAYLRNYLDLQLLRFDRRCRISYRWPEDSTRFTIPPLLLIMLVENAFKHGVEPFDGESSISIILNLEGGRMHFTCRNEPADTPGPAATSGVGLTNLRRRLEILFGGNFQLSSAPDGQGWKAELSLDLRPC